MESFLTPYSLSNSGQEKLQFTPFLGGLKPVCSDGLRVGTIKSHNFICLRSYPGEISHSNSPNRQLSNELSYFTPVLTRPDLSGPTHNTMTHVRSCHNVIFCTFERSYSSVLRPILVKLHILTRLIESFPMVHLSWSCIEIEMFIPLGAHA